MPGKLGTHFLRQQVLSPVPQCHLGEIKIFKLQYYVWKSNVACYSVCSNSDLLRRGSNVYHIIYLCSGSVLPKMQMYPWKSKGRCYRELCSLILHSPLPVTLWQSRLLTSVMGSFSHLQKYCLCSIRTERSLACIPSKIHKSLKKCWPRYYWYHDCSQIHICSNITWTFPNEINTYEPRREEQET